MTFVSSNMGFKSWPDPKDRFSFDDLAANFGKVDVHTHELGKGSNLSGAAFANNAITTPKLGTDLGVAQFASSALTTAKLTNSPLASPRWMAYITAVIPQSSVAASTTYTVQRNGTLSTTGTNPFWWQYNSADWVMPNKTPFLVFKGSYQVNAIGAGTATTTFGWYNGNPTPAGTSGNLIITAGSNYQGFVVPSSASAADFV